jgi:SAM-dependent methyltransferase
LIRKQYKKLKLYNYIIQLYIKIMSDSIFNVENKKNIEALYKKVQSDDEFEFIFYNFSQDVDKMSLESYLKILEYIKYKSNASKLKITTSNALDIIYSEGNESFRLSVSELPVINNLMESIHQRKNHVIFAMILGMYQNKDSIVNKNITLINKKRNFGETINIEDYNIRVKLSKELPVKAVDIKRLESLNHTLANSITFRYKQRTSLFLVNDDTAIIRLDLTNTKMTKDINTLETSISIYELEIDCTIKKHGKHLDVIFAEIHTLLRILQQSNYIVSRSTTNAVIEYYANLLSLDVTKITSLDMRKPESLEVQHIVEKLPNKYAVTDKADGTRHFLIIYSNRIYLISDILKVIDLGITVPDDKFNGVIMDGEYIFIKKENRYVFLVFDCLYYNNNNIRVVNNFLDRLDQATSIINEIFKRKYAFKRYDGNYDSKKVLDHYYNEIKSYTKFLNEATKIDKKFPLICTKMFIPVLGVDDNEIFKYASLMWKGMLQDSNINCPYILDGLMFHPLNQEYSVSRDTKLFDYKWKPQEKNSIDFYIEFEMDTDGKPYVVYDNSNKDEVTNKPYKICHLFVGKTDKSGEHPVPFLRELGKGIAYLFLDNGDVRDMSGNIIKSGTVVEFYYNNDLSISDKYRWVPIKTRYDKTEHVHKYKRKYGNYSDIATRIWRSIENPVLFSDFIQLANDSTYNVHLEKVRGRVDHSVIMSEQQENAYYQLTTNLAKPFRHYQNWIKSLMIYTFCNPLYEDKKKKNILDIGCGRGGDIMKYYYNNVTNIYIGVDKDNNGLIAPTQGAISRYNALRRNKANFPFMAFINADAGVNLSLEDQMKVFPLMSKANVDLIRKFLGHGQDRVMYERISCQLAIHYFLENNVVWNNFLKNISNVLLPGGLMLVTTFDADKIINLLKDSDNYVSNYNTTDGEQKVLFEVVKKYSPEQIKNIKTNGVAVPIDFSTSMYLLDGNYVTEYLVDKDFLEKEFLEKCDMELVETDLFENQYYIHESYLAKYAKYEENPLTRKFLMEALSFYDQKNELNKVSFDLMKLYRFYIFRRKDGVKKKMSRTTKSRADKVTFNDEVVNKVPRKKVANIPYAGDVESIDFRTI